MIRPGQRSPLPPDDQPGALVTTDIVTGESAEERLERIIATLRLYAANERLALDDDTFEAELHTADRNRPTAYRMRSDGMLASRTT